MIERSGWWSLLPLEGRRGYDGEAEVGVWSEFLGIDFEFGLFSGYVDICFTAIC